MPLSEEEQRVLDALERQFAEGERRNVLAAGPVAAVTSRLGGARRAARLCPRGGRLRGAGGVTLVLGLSGVSVVITGMLLLVEPSAKRLRELLGGLVGRVDERRDRTR